MNNVVYARYEYEKYKNLLIKENDDEKTTNDKISLIEYDKERGRDKFMSINFINYENENDSVALSNTNQLFREKVKRPNSAFSLADRYVCFSLFNDIPIGTWFSDQVATAYCLLLNQRESALRKVLIPNRKRLLYLDQTFFEIVIDKIKVNSISKVENDKRDEKLKHSYKGFKLFTYDKIFLYANQNNNHWVLYEIDVQQAQICLYDSYYDGISSISQIQFNQIKYYIKINSIDKGVNKRWTTQYKPCRFQSNTDDCGVYMLIFSLFISDFSFEYVKRISMKYARLKIAMDITRGYIEDPRLDGYNYFNDASHAGLDGIPVFDYEQLMIDLTDQDDDDDDDDDDIQYIMTKNKSYIESLELRIKQDQEILSIGNIVKVKIEEKINNEITLPKKKKNSNDEEELAKKKQIEVELRKEMEKEMEAELQRRNAEMQKKFEEKDAKWKRKMEEKEAKWKKERESAFLEKEEALREKAELVQEKAKLLEQIENLKK
jgi:hypothetical protein